MSAHYPAVRRKISSVDPGARRLYADRRWNRASTSIPTSSAARIWKVPAKFRPKWFFCNRSGSGIAKRPTRRILDIACGDSPHGRLLAGDGFEVVGIDRSPTMIAAGRRKARALANLRFYRRPIEKFTLPERAFDAAIFMSETFPVIVENADLLSHLKSVGRALKRGGLYCIDIDRQDPTAARDATHDVARTHRARRRGRARHPRISSPDRVAFAAAFDLRTRMHDQFSRPAPVTTRDLIPVRYTTPSTLELAALASGMFKMDAAYCDLSFTKPLDRMPLPMDGSAAARDEFRRRPR